MLFSLEITALNAHRERITREASQVMYLEFSLHTIFNLKVRPRDFGRFIPQQSRESQSIGKEKDNNEMNTWKMTILYILNRSNNLDALGAALKVP
jgi:hypothetical protein